VKKIKRPETKAEGKLKVGAHDFPYDTQLVSIDGVDLHVWLGDIKPTPELLKKIERRAKNQRDVVRLTYSSGKPIGFWADNNF
jgi:hypothetical protein